MGIGTFSDNMKLIISYFDWKDDLKLIISYFDWKDGLCARKRMKMDLNDLSWFLFMIRRGGRKLF